MTEEEKANFQTVLDKMRTNTATKQDLINNGLIIQVVLPRLPDDKKAFVQKFFSDADHSVGNDMVNVTNK